MAQHIEKALGVRPRWIGNTRTNAQIFELPEGLALQAAQSAVRQISNIDGILWAEVETLSLQQPAQTKSERGEEPADISEFIIKLKEDNLRLPPDAGAVKRLSNTIGHQLTPIRNTTVSRVFSLGQWITASQAQAIEQVLETDPVVVYADPVKRVQPQSIVPNDPDFYGQWHLFDPSISPGGANVQAAWEATKGNPGATVAIIDTGALFEHPDLKRGMGSVTKKSRYRGWDMISSALGARDGNGRDDYAGDEGDWAPGFLADQVCTSARDSSWHGSHVAGIVAATTQNHQGVSGINWNAKLVPVRVLGACGGTGDDVNDGIYWAAGHREVPGAHRNKLQVNVINMSLGGTGACPDSRQAAIDFALAKGISVVVSAGNSHADVKDFSPASCRGVISVSSIGPTGDLAYYSNYGTGVTLAAPGGETKWSIYNEKDTPIDARRIWEYGILSAVNRGKQRPEKGAMGYAWYQGTSMASPVVAGVVSLMLAVDHKHRLNPSSIREILQDTARPFPETTEKLVMDPITQEVQQTTVASRCSTTLAGQCGAGIVDAYQAILAVKSLQKQTNH